MSETTHKLATEESILDLNETLKQQNQILALATKNSVDTIAGTWGNIQGLVRAGLGSTVFDFGDILTESWIDVDNSNKSYDYPWHVNHFGKVTLSDGTQTDGMYIQGQYATLKGIQFSNSRAFLACPDGLAAGTYNVKFGANWGGVKKDSVFQFTITNAVPTGGRIAGFRYMADGSAGIAGNAAKVYVYDAKGVTVLETVTATAGSGGTALGTINLDTRNGNLNSMHECGYGCNRWKTSAMRQYLNSDKPKGQWWVAQDEWDIAPEQLSTTSGFLTGLSDEFLGALKEVQVVTYDNNPTGKGQKDITYDKVFLPSLTEMYINPQHADEGEVHEYWQRRSGSSSKFAQWGTYPNLIHYAVENHTSAQGVRLRSASVGSACSAWGVYSSGHVGGSGYACDAWRSAPIAVIA